MIRWIKIFLISFSLTFWGLAEAGAPKRPADDNLTAEFAKFRRTQVRTVEYEMSFTLNKGADEYSGRTLIRADLNKVDLPLSVDLMTKKITEVKVNGKIIGDYIARTGSLDIPPKYLTPSVQIEIAYTNSYNKDGEGFQHSVDPEDKAEYVFTDFEPYHAHHFFPCFDQPDLKATYKVTVDGPKDWKVIGNDLIASAKTTGDRTVTTFNKSRPFSTYLVFVSAGPWAQWNDTADGIPMELYSRKSLAKYVDAKNIFETSRKGLKFYAQYFGHPYPFPKFGQIFLPEFAWGGMENPGAISYDEGAIFRGPVSQARIESRDGLIFHEMAHMWFGDLVTMSWWNDLWLNESFASYMAFLAQDRALGQASAWMNDYSYQTWGYWQDQLVTTHPIETEVKDVRTARGNFDGITYAKGAATLKQLHYLVGDEAFKKGLAAYFKKYAYQNSVRADFVEAIAAAAGQDLKQWTKAWLQTAGPNRVQTKWTCKDGKVDTFSIDQTKNASRSYAPHRTEIAFYKSEAGGQLSLQKTLPITYSTASTKLTEAVGLPCPDFVYPNSRNQDYALFSLDQASLKLAKQALTGGMQDPLTRLMVWGTLAQMVRDSQLAVSEYMAIALAGIERESNDNLLSILLGRHGTLRDYYVSYLTKEQREQLAPKFEAVTWRKTLEQVPGSSIQMTYFDFYVRMVQTKEGQVRLADFLQNKQLPKGFKLDQQRRWQIITSLAANGYPAATDLITSEEKVDNTTEGKRISYAARIAIPDPSLKMKFWQDLQKRDQLPFSTIRMAAGRFNDTNHVELSEPFITPYFKTIMGMDWAANDMMIDVYFESLFPHNVCTPQLLNESQTKLRQAKNLVPLARRAWLESNDELEKCISVRAFEKKRTM